MIKLTIVIQESRKLKSTVISGAAERKDATPIEIAIEQNFMASVQDAAKKAAAKSTHFSQN